MIKGYSLKKKLVIFMAFMLASVMAFSGMSIMPAEAAGEDEPIFTIAAISDIHTDAGIQEWDDPLRNDVYTTVDAIYFNEDADVLLLGGDLTSAHMGGSWGATDEEKKANFKRAQAAIINAAESATDSHRVLYATGNHEFAVGTKDFNSGDYIDATERNLPKLVDAKDINDTDANAYFQRTMPEGTAANVRHVLAYHYNIDGMDFMVLNTPYTGEDNHSNYEYDEESLIWVANKMEAIGRDKTVFFIAHYPLGTDKNVTSGKSVNAATQAVLKEEILDNYPNAIYLYGHDHGGYKIHFDTYERVTTYDENGQAVDNRDDVPAGFVSSFVGSMSYYADEINPYSLGSADPNIVQGLMVYVYSDRIVFQMKNYGAEDLGSYVLKEYTLMRDMSSYIPAPDKDTPAETPDFTTNLPANDAVSAPVVIDDAKVTTPQAGDVFSVDGILQYKITKASEKTGTVSVNKVLKSKNKIVIPDTVINAGYTFRVTAIDKNTFKKDHKIKNIVVGANIKKIGNNCFAGCKNLKKITFKCSKPPATGKNAFKGVNKKIKISYPEKMKKKQVALLKKRVIKS